MSLNSAEAFQRLYREVSKNVAVASLAISQNVRERDRRMMGAVRFTGDTPKYVVNRLSISQRISGLCRLTVQTYFKKAFLEYWELRYYYVKEHDLRKLADLDQKLRTFPVSYAFCEVADSIARTTFDMYFGQWATVAAQLGLDRDKREGEQSEFEQAGMGWIAAESERLSALELKQKIAAREHNIPQEDVYRFPTFGDTMMQARHEMAAILHAPETAFDLPDETSTTTPAASPTPAVPEPKKSQTKPSEATSIPPKKEEVLLPSGNSRVTDKNSTT